MKPRERSSAARKKPPRKTVGSARERVEQMDERRMRREGRPATTRRVAAQREDA